VSEPLPSAHLGVALVDCDGGGAGGARDIYEPPVLKNLMVNFGAYDATTGMADFFFAASFDKVFLSLALRLLAHGPKLYQLLNISFR
jgi:hypothetical protein